MTAKADIYTAAFGRPAYEPEMMFKIKVTFSLDNNMGAHIDSIKVMGLFSTIGQGWSLLTM